MSLTRAALLLLAVPGHALRHKKTNSSKAQAYIVTMGDSFSSGTGIHKAISSYHEGDACCREFKTTPGGQLSRNEGLAHLMPACAGDELPNIKDQLSQLTADHPVETAAGWEGSTFVLTIGGNDIRSNGGKTWPGILADCILNFVRDCHKNPRNQVANFQEVQDELADFYDRLAKTANKAVIRVWGYPRLLQRTWLGCVPIPGVTNGATDWMDRMCDELSSRVSAAVLIAKSRNPGVDLEFVGVNKYFTKGACTTFGNQVHGLVLNFENLMSPMTFHPSQAGYNEYYNALANSLGRGLPPSDVYPGPPEPWEVDSMFVGWDSNGDGKLSIEEVLDMGGEDADPEVTRTLRGLFTEADRNQDGFLDLEEFRIFLTLVAREGA